MNDPSRVELDRIAHGVNGPVYALFDLATMPRAVAAARHLRLRGTAVVAVRGRAVPASVGDAFTQLYLGDRFTDLLAETSTGLGWPAGWRHPILFADVARAGGRSSERLGVVFSRLPDLGILDVGDLGRAGIREGAVAATLRSGRDGDGIDLAPDALASILREIRRAGCSRVLLVDLGGESESLAFALSNAGVLGGFFAQARSAIPAPILTTGVPLYTWFEVEDVPRIVPAACHGCAYVPVALPGELPGDAEARLADVRASGYAAVVPRYHLPVPATGEWERIVARFPFRHVPGMPLDGSRLIFALPGWDEASAAPRLAAWQQENRWPEAPAAPAPLTPYSLASLRIVLDGVLRDVRAGAPDRHARDLFDELRCEMGSGPFEAQEQYPFLAWNGESLLSLVDRSVVARLQSLVDVPDDLARAVRHTALAGGKRLRPILALVVAGAFGVPPAIALPAALTLEWLHTASLIQDDLPSMDDDPVRRRVASAHVRHGEGLALLASDALVALAFEDLARLADDPAIGPSKASALVAGVAREIGAAGVIGGQARDLVARDARRIDLAALLEIHRRKTAPLFRLAATIGTVLGSATPAARQRLETLLADLGVAFQIVDDLLDAGAGDAGEFGRPPGSDARHRRLTFATALHNEGARALAEALVAPITTVARSRPSLHALAKLAGFVLSRRG